MVESVVLLSQLISKKQALIADIESQARTDITHVMSDVAVLRSNQAALPPTVNTLNIYDENDQLLWSSGSPASWQDKHALLSNWRHSSNGHSYHVVTRLDVTSAYDALYADLLNRLPQMLISAIGLMLGTWIILNLLVVKPLREVVSAFGDDSTAPLDKWKRDDEIGELVESYNAMQQDTVNAERRVQIKQNHLEYMAYHDVLTNLPNRRAFLAQFDAIDNRAPTLIYIIGIDNLKIINDQHGSDIGDAIIAENGRRLSTLSGSDCFCARLEGDELGLLQQLQSDISENELKNYAQRALETLNSPHTYLTIDVQVTVSIGIALSGSRHCSVDTAFKNAAIALNRAKISGRGRYCLFDQSMREQIEHRLSMVSAMEKAIDGCEFFPVYQPKVCMRRKQVIGAECLIRWRRADGSVTPPGEFIPLAEETGLIIPMSEQLLRRAIMDSKEWQNRGLSALTVALNMSAVQLRDLRFPDKVNRILTEMGFPPEYIELEITESAVMESTTKAIRAMAALKSRGISLAIDDFGTGQSSLSYLKQFPVDTLKIDQSFVSGMCESKHDKAIVNAVIDLSHRFGLEVVAEGIETQQQLDQLNTMGCDTAQGYYLGKPMPSEEFFQWCQDEIQHSA